MYTNSASLPKKEIPNQGQIERTESDTAASVTPPPETLSEVLESWTTIPHHPSLMDFRLKATQKGITGVAEIENAAFKEFKKSLGFESFSNEMGIAKATLIKLFEDDSQACDKAYNGLEEILARAEITQTVRQNNAQGEYGPASATVVESTCLILRQLAGIVDGLNNSPPQNVDVKDSLGAVRACILEIITEAQMCGPGLIDKAEQSYNNLIYISLCPASISAAIEQTQITCAREVLRNICDISYVQTGQIPAGNEVHYAYAWQKHLAQTKPEDYAWLLPKKDDLNAPYWENIPGTSILQPSVEQSLAEHANIGKACQYLAESFRDTFVTKMGAKTNDINTNYSEFQSIFNGLKQRCPHLTESHFLYNDEDGNHHLCKDSNNLTLFLLRSLPPEKFTPQEIIKVDGLDLYSSGGLMWTESIDPKTGEEVVNFDDPLSGFLQDLQTESSLISNPIDKILHSLGANN